MNCPFCNQPIREGAAFCGVCGKRLADAVNTEAEAQTESAEAVQTAEAAENVAQEVGSAASVIADTTVEAEAADVTTPDAAGNATPDTSNNVQSVSAVNLGKNNSASDSQENTASANNVADQVRDGIQDVAAAVQSDTQGAVAAVKSGNFKELLKNKTFLICCAALIAVILLIVIIAGCAAAAGSAHKVKGSYYCAEDGGDAVYFYNGSIVKGVDLSASSSVLATSLDGTVAVVEDGTDLYLFKSGKATLITDDFDTSNASISANGKTVAYVSDDCVYLYTGGKPKKIADLENDKYCYPVISPNGKVIAFSDKDDDDIQTYVWKGGSKAIDLDSDIIPFSVSNGGKMIYGADESGNLCFIQNLKKSGEEKIDSISRLSGISLDHTKLLYVSDGATYCFDTSMDKEDGVRITRGVITPFYDFSYQGSVPYINDFKKFYGKENGNLYKYFRKGKEYDDEKLLSDVGSMILSENNKSFVYIDDGDVMKGTISNAKNAKKIAKDAISVRANDSLSAIFYCDDDRTLRFAGKDGKIASDVKRYVVTDGGVCVFSDYDGDLYYSVKGGEKKKTSLDEISSLVIRNDVIYVVSDGELYTSTNGKSFKKTGVDAD
ncbi:MAG: hypothetical protein ACI4JS_02855 [Oscillospiraceae bacterium]